MEVFRQAFIFPRSEVAHLTESSWLVSDVMHGVQAANLYPLHPFHQSFKHASHVDFLAGAGIFLADLDGVDGGIHFPAEDVAGSGVGFGWVDEAVAQVIDLQATGVPAGQDVVILLSKPADDADVAVVGVGRQQVMVAIDPSKRLEIPGFVEQAVLTEIEDVFVLLLDRA